MALTDEDIITDLKQFIAATVSQEVSRLDIRMDGLEQHMNGLGQRMNGLEVQIRTVDRKIDDLSASVAEALDASNEVTAAQLKDHGRRIARLEKRAA